MFVGITLAVGLICAAFGADNPFPKGIEVRNYQGWRESIYLNATEKAVQAVVVPGIGGRLVHFSLNGTNILFENFGSLGKTLFTGSNLWFGGYQCQLGPDSRALAEEAEFYSKVNKWQLTGDFALKVSGASDSSPGVAIDKEFVLAPDTGDLGLIQRLRNTSDTERSFSMQDRTVCKNGGFVIVPLKPKSRFKNGWSYCYEFESQWVYDGDTPRVAQVQAKNGIMVVEARGPTTRVGADSDEGWIAYVRENVLFIKYFPTYPEGSYPDGGNTVFLSFDQRIMQFGPVSPEFKLAPGGEAIFPEKWVLIELSKEVTTPEQARKLVKKIRSSKF